MNLLMDKKIEKMKDAKLS